MSSFSARLYRAELPGGGASEGKNRCQTVDPKRSTRRSARLRRVLTVLNIPPGELVGYPHRAKNENRPINSVRSMKVRNIDQSIRRKLSCKLSFDFLSSNFHNRRGNPHGKSSEGVACVVLTLLLLRGTTVNMTKYC